jgi:hypothetical protein
MPGLVRAERLALGPLETRLHEGVRMKPRTLALVIPLFLSADLSAQCTGSGVAGVGWPTVATADYIHEACDGRQYLRAVAVWIGQPASWKRQPGDEERLRSNVEFVRAHPELQGYEFGGSASPEAVWFLGWNSERRSAVVVHSPGAPEVRQLGRYAVPADSVLVILLDRGADSGAELIGVDVVPDAGGFRFKDGDVSDHVRAVVEQSERARRVLLKGGSRRFDDVL